MTRSRPVCLGLPLWGQANWRGNLYPEGMAPAAFLRQYAQILDAVEGNTTFYTLPSVDRVARWREATPEHFRFCFKFPRSITHEAGLRDADGEVARFLDRMAPLGARLGPFMVQLPASFGPAELPRLDDFLAALPATHRYGVEVRHPELFSRQGSRALASVLSRHGVERIIMDTRGMRAGDPCHADLVRAAHAKPDLPVSMRALTDRPMVRFVAHPVASVNAAFLTRWAAVITAWVDAGRTPYFFMHCPDNRHAPELALWLDRLITARVPSQPLPPFAGLERPGVQARSRAPQLELL
ncbi:MAG TPA: DUF72 domain-containing protein [Pseudomonadales bacterium]|nr:DUF72 domain-containing protein [Pseudomonadales bacterium]